MLFLECGVFRVTLSKMYDAAVKGPFYYLDSGQVVCADRDQGALSAQILVQLVL